MYYHVSRNLVIEELPLYYNKPDTVYRSFGDLHDRGLIVYRKDGKKDLMKLTEKGKEWNKKLGNKSEKKPKLGNKSEKTRIQIRKNSDSNPTNNNINNNNINNNKKILSNDNIQKDEIEETIKSFHVSDETKEMFRNFREHRKKKNKTLKDSGVFKKLVRELGTGKFKDEKHLRESIQESIDFGYQGVFPVKNYDFEPKFKSKSIENTDSMRRLAEIGRRKSSGNIDGNSE